MKKRTIEEEFQAYKAWKQEKRPFQKVVGWIYWKLLPGPMIFIGVMVAIFIIAMR